MLYVWLGGEFCVAVLWFLFKDVVIEGEYEHPVGSPNILVGGYKPSETY